MKIQIASYTDKNQRAANEDCHIADEGLGLFVVCDGVGGNPFPRLASETCVNAIREHVARNAALIRAFRDDPGSVARKNELLSLIQSAIQYAGTRIFEIGSLEPAKRGMATTVEALLVVEDHAFLGHVGDSRTYLVREGQVYPLSEDHTVAVELFRHGVCSREQAEKHRQAATLTRAVGSLEFFRVDTLHFQVNPGDRLVLCTDGLYKGIQDELLAQEMADRALADAARRGGSTDNMTWVSLSVQGDEVNNETISVLKKSDILGKVPIFRYLSYPELMKVLSLVNLRTYPSTQLAEEGSVSEEMFIVVSGEVEVRKRGHLVATRKKGDVIGEMGLFDRARRSASLQAAGDTTVMAIGRKELLDLLRAESRIAVKLFWALNQELNRRLRDTTKELADAKDGLMSVGREDLPFLDLEAPGDRRR